MMSLSFHFFSQDPLQKKSPSLSKTVEQSGDFLQIALPFSSFVQTLLVRDPIGTYQLCLAISSSTILTWIPKIFIVQKRPNGGKHSMPSGHTSLSFAATVFLLMRYGMNFSGLAMVGAASFVALSRIYTQWHYCLDVIIGFLIGIFAALFWTKKRKRL